MTRKGRSPSVTLWLILLILLLIWPINLFILLETSHLSDNMLRQAGLQIENTLDVRLAELDSEIKKTDYLLYYMHSESANGITLLKQEGDTAYTLAKSSFFRELSSQANLLDSADGYGYHLKRTDDWLCWSKGNDPDAYDFWKQIETAGFPQKGWTLQEIGGAPILIRIQEAEDVFYGAFIYLPAITGALPSHLEYGSEQIFFSEQPAAASSQMISVSAASARSNAYLNVLLEKQTVLGSMTLLQRIERYFSLLSFVLIVLLYFFLRWLLVRPLQRINQAHRELEQGNLDYRIPQTAHSAEYQYAFDSFNTMADNLKSLTIENYEKEIRSKKMELRNLQLQIRPHFLLNMFNMIYTMAQNREFDTIQDAIVYLSDYFRYIFREQRELDFLSREIDLVRRYLDIAALRYPDRIEAEFDLDPRTDVVRIPPLLIHNLAENIIKHALNSEDVTNILIRTAYENRLVTIEISDDGIGMDEQTREQLMAFARLPDRQADPGSGHIGIKNSILRLRHYFGDKASLTVESEPGLGTSIFIRIAYDLEADHDTSDRE